MKKLKVKLNKGVLPHFYLEDPEGFIEHYDIQSDSVLVFVPGIKKILEVSLSDVTPIGYEEI